MRYMGMPLGMWLLYRRSFQRQLTAVLGYPPQEAGQIARRAGPRYRQIIAGLPDFEKSDRFRMNIVNCAMLSAFLLSMERHPELKELTEYYERAMMTPPTRWFCRMSGRRKFTEQDVRSMRETAALRAADRNPYSWNMDVLPYPDGEGYEARFTHCGICTLMKELGLFDLTPAMCHLDYSMSEAGGVSEFVREYTLAGGGPYCDCGYRKKALR